MKSPPWRVDAHHPEAIATTKRAADPNCSKAVGRRVGKGSSNGCSYVSWPAGADTLRKSPCRYCVCAAGESNWLGMCQPLFVRLCAHDADTQSNLESRTRP